MNFHLTCRDLWTWMRHLSLVLQGPLKLMHTHHAMTSLAVIFGRHCFRGTCYEMVGYISIGNYYCKGVKTHRASPAHSLR